MKHAQNYFKERGYHTELVELHTLVKEKDLPKGLECAPAYILLVKRGLSCLLE